MKPRKLIDYKNLPTELIEQLKKKYAQGYADSLITFFAKDGLAVTALPFETDDIYYMIKMPSNTVFNSEEEEEDKETFDEIPQDESLGELDEENYMIIEDEEIE